MELLILADAEACSFENLGPGVSPCQSFELPFAEPVDTAVAYGRDQQTVLKPQSKRERSSGFGARSNGKGPANNRAASGFERQPHRTANRAVIC